MELDDLEPRQNRTEPLAQKDLSMMSIEDLNDRIEELKAEIKRCEDMVASKQGSRADAETFFKK